MADTCRNRLRAAFFGGLSLTSLAAFAQVAGSAVQNRDEVVKPPDPFLESMSTVLMIFIGAIVVGLYFIYRKRMDAIRDQEAMAEAQFEADLLGRRFSEEQTGGVAQLSAIGADSLQDNDQNLTHQPIHPEIPLGGYQPHSSSLLAAHSSTQDRVDLRLDWVIQALTQAGLLQEVESVDPWHGVPKAAAILKLKRDRRALLIQDLDSLPAMAQVLQRYDMVIVGGVKPRAIVIQTLQQAIADQF